MKASDFSTITATGVLAAALFALLSSFGVDAPVWIPALVPLLTTMGIATVRIYASVVGEDNTQADERLEAVEDLIEAIALYVEQKRDNK